MNPKSLANLRPAKPGEVRNPVGRKSAGACVQEWYNILSEKGLTQDQLRKMAKDNRIPWAKGMAAYRMLRARESPDLADFEPVLTGEIGLQQIRKKGIDTSVLKKIKTKTRTIPQKDGEPLVEVEREVELRDTSLAESEAIMDRTVGKATQDLNISGTIEELDDATLLERGREITTRVGAQVDGAILLVSPTEGPK